MNKVYLWVKTIYGEIDFLYALDGCRDFMSYIMILWTLVLPFILFLPFSASGFFIFCEISYNFFFFLCSCSFRFFSTSTKQGQRTAHDIQYQLALLNLNLIRDLPFVPLQTVKQYEI